ncbi:hypothetical protein ONZ45_g17625 [Pleurotus djamor]|nr:hypothetical protein ONZ45_g17625 [Pleurotus djamor]
MASPIHLWILPWNIPDFSAQGVTVDILSSGDGVTFPRKGDKVTIHYVGTLLDGKIFDSSRERGVPFETTIGVGQVIKGWDEGAHSFTLHFGVMQLSIGSKALLTCTPDYAYGSRGFPPSIPANSTLRFEVEVIQIQRAG